MKITGRLVESIVIIVDASEKDKAIKYCADEGFNIIHSGAKPLGLREYSDSQVKIIAEKELNRCQTKKVFRE